MFVQTVKAASTLVTAQLNYHILPAPHGIISLSRSTQSKSFAHTQEAHCWHLCCFAADNQVLAGKAGALQVVLAGLERHKSSEPVTEQGFAALINICAIGIPVT